MIGGMWKSFEKAGEPGWAALTPFYNLMVVAKIAGLGEPYSLARGSPSVTKIATCKSVQSSKTPGVST